MSRHFNIDICGELARLRARVRELEARLAERDPAADMPDDTARRLEDFASVGNGWFWETDAELRFTQAAIGQRDARAYETPGQKIRLMSQILMFDLDESFVGEQQTILEEFTTAEARTIAAERLNLEDMIMIVVGDKAAVFEELTELGWPIVELSDPDGASTPVAEVP